MLILLRDLFLVQENFYKEKQDEKNDDIYSNIDEMLQDTLSDEENSEKDPLKK